MALAVILYQTVRNIIPNWPEGATTIIALVVHPMSNRMWRTKQPEIVYNHYSIVGHLYQTVRNGVPKRQSPLPFLVEEGVRSLRKRRKEGGVQAHSRPGLPYRLGRIDASVAIVLRYEIKRLLALLNEDVRGADLRRVLSTKAQRA